MSQTVVATSPTPGHAPSTIAGEGVLDSTAYPHLVDKILLANESDDLITLRALSRTWKTAADARLAAHPVVQLRQDQDGASQPTWLGSAVPGKQDGKNGSQWLPRFELRAVDDTDDSDFDPDDQDSDDDYGSARRGKRKRVKGNKTAARHAKALLVKQRAYTNKLFSRHATIVDVWGTDVQKDRLETFEELLKPGGPLAHVTTMRVMAPIMYWYPPLPSTTVLFCGSQGGGFFYLSSSAQRLVFTFLITPSELGSIHRPDYETTYPGDPDVHFVFHFINSDNGPKGSSTLKGGETLKEIVTLLGFVMQSRSKVTIVGARHFFMDKLGLPLDAQGDAIGQALHDIGVATFSQFLGTTEPAEYMRNVKFVDPAAYEAEVGAWQVDLETMVDPYRGERATYHA